MINAPLRPPPPAYVRSEVVALELSAREHEILALMAGGFANPAICSRLWVSSKTVESHIRSIFMKLGLTDRAVEHPRVAAVLAYLDARGAS